KRELREGEPAVGAAHPRASQHDEHREESHAHRERHGRERDQPVVVETREEEHHGETEQEPERLALHEEEFGVIAIGSQNRARGIDHDEPKRKEPQDREEYAPVEFARLGDHEAHRRAFMSERLSSSTAAANRAPRSSKLRNMSSLAAPGAT